jgi:predicted dehydrogenase
MNSATNSHFLIVGASGIAQRQMAVLRQLVPQARFTVWRQRSLPCGEGVPIVHTLADAIAARPHAAIIASPASHHLAAAVPFAVAGVDLFVEKPLAATLDGVETFLQACEANRLVLQVGYCLRFSNGFSALAQILREGTIGRPLHLSATVGQYLPDWRPARDYRETVSARASSGGGAVLELSHELDYVRALLGTPVAVSAQLMRSGTLDLDVEDCGDAIIEFASGAVANVHIDMLNRSPGRHCRIVASDGTAEWDVRADTVRVFRARAGEWETAVAPSSTTNDMYERQISHFLDCVARRAEPAVSGRDGVDSLALALAVKRSAERGQRVPL